MYMLRYKDTTRVHKRPLRVRIAAFLKSVTG